MFRVKFHGDYYKSNERSQYEKKITIRWEGPLKVDKVVNEYYIDNDEVRSDLGLYQIYGPHIIYSNKKCLENDKVLLYIGKTTRNTFSGRISNHGFCHKPNHEVYLGRVEGIEYNSDESLWEKTVSDVEKILINRYAPSYNANLTGDLNKNQLNNSDIVLINAGEKADLEEYIDVDDVVYMLK